MVGIEKLETQGNSAISTGRLTIAQEGELASGPVLAGRTHLAWGAVIAGALTTLALLALSSSLAFACDVPAFRGGDYGFGAGVWSVISAAIAFYIGGAVVSFLSPRSEMQIGILHGVMSWVLAVNLTLLGTSIGLLRGFISWDLLRQGMMTPGSVYTPGSVAGPAWGAFVSLAVALLFAAVGGMAGLRISRRGMGGLTGGTAAMK